jgi:hypothetical protein
MWTSCPLHPAWGQSGTYRTRQLRTIRLNPVGGTSADFAVLIGREIAQWRDVIAAAKITVQ